ncbi:hypothetical protein RvY_05700 [Ramazzottius varieornatus]|uniref:Uncharacterized protein n=1 Tax=Ramazzottius varieornatus TaxID=947166 RepID=A0A1D1V5N9_RAMVA|nr:hypothetical protein RvY_05700 [Ramazzottius varieornatus]
MGFGLTVKENVKSIWNAPVSEQGLGFRRHTLCFSCGMSLMGILCVVFQAAEVAQHRSYSPQSNGAALHYYNGFWNGFGLFLTSMCGILTAIFYLDREPIFKKISAREITLTVPFADRSIKSLLKKYSYLTLKILLAAHMCLFGSGLGSLVLSAVTYPNFLKSFNPTITDQQTSLGTELVMTTTDNPGLANFTVSRPPKVDRALQKVRITCLTLQASLTWCTLMGLFLTALCGTITLNRVLLQEQIANQGFEPSQATLKRQASATASARSQRRKSVVSAVRKVSRALSTVTSRKASTVTQPNIPSTTKTRGTLDPGRPVRQAERSSLAVPASNLSLPGTSLTVPHDARSAIIYIEPREAALQTMAEFLRNRKMSQHNLRVPSQYELQPTP